MSAGVVIAGGGLAGQRCAEALRRCGYEAPVRMVCAEQTAPYDRPPLSKGFLRGDLKDRDVVLRPASWHRDNDIELILGDAATGLDPGRRRLALQSGSTLAYEHLVVATGSQARRLPGAQGCDNAHVLRTLADATRLREALQSCGRLVVLGAGLIGQEVAATAASIGVEVTLVEADELPLARIVHKSLAAWLVELQREHGVGVLLGARVTRLETARGSIRAVHLQDGRRLELDALLVAIGIAPAIDWLPLELRELVRRPEILAIGDAAGGHHWEAAANQGRAAAASICGAPMSPTGLPSWWSDIHGVRLQGVGDLASADQVELDGDPMTRSFTALGLRHGVAVGGLAVGRPRDLPRLRELLTPPVIEEAA